MNQTFFKISLIKEVADIISSQKELLLDELIDNATDPVISMRRIRMLHQLAQYESDLIRIIDNFDSQNPNEWLAINNIVTTIDYIVDRSA